MDITNSLLSLEISAECGFKNATKNEEILSTSSDPGEHMNVIEICCHASDPEKPFIHFDRKVQGASPVSKKQSYSVRKVQGRGTSSVPQKQSLPAAGKVQGTSSVLEEQSYPNKEIPFQVEKQHGTIETFKLSDFTLSIEINAVSKLNFQLFTEEYVEEMMKVIRGTWCKHNWDYNTNFRLFADMLETIREYITDLHSSICTLNTDIIMVGLRSQRRRELQRLTIKTVGLDNMDTVNDPPEPNISKERYLVLIAYYASMSAIHYMYRCYCLAFQDALNVRACCERYFAEFQD
ncbi:hypothetical protein CEXT_759061 [Caerostris extrusa]|uniref:Uncharacterized protein n=1 Tax=Caerostris extrusa TaxID=172846 RepID=A0AAV4NKI1_CAEEX|nr:hypothetical protein CEXT_759061 [Caerostris extrusa]